ncbi:MAG: hypothetical protein JXR96_10420 [Deltaproteobacteria bacterium]|nr:hypothetical protein [Deltaproteobacteria bacterium]
MRSRGRGRIERIAVVLVLAVCSAACITVWRARFMQLDDYTRIETDDPFLKCHTWDGWVYVLSAWELDREARRIQGQGVLYDADRDRVRDGRFEIPFDKVALVETNEPRRMAHAGMVVMGIVTGASVALTAVCLANPKACFGSCPTFYAREGQELHLQAEAFSASVARALESSDIDALATTRVEQGRIELLMTNDALETHAVRELRLLVAPRPEGGRVFHARDAFYPARSLTEPSKCRGEAGDCLEPVRAFDRTEYISAADGRDLAARERIELEFEKRPEGSLGLVIGGRNSLLNTFLFYQALAYMGIDAGEYMVKLERKGKEALDLVAGPGRLLGDVEVEVRSRAGWVRAGAFDEVGPIARELQIVRLPDDLPEGPVRLRLNLCKGNWKIDWLALAGIGEPVEPVAIPPSRVVRGQKDGHVDAEALAAILDPDAYLFTYPQDAYWLIFELPPGSWEPFLQARGFYYEWIRDQWLPEKNPEKLADLLLEPERMLKELAPAYKRLEPSMERVFWQSRLGREGVR